MPWLNKPLFTGTNTNHLWILIGNQMPRTKEIIGEARIEDLASNIKKRRRWLRMTQTELGKQIGVTQQRIAMFEKGDAIPDVFQIESIASVLDTTIEILLNLTREEIMNNENVSKKTMNILASMQAREQLLESLNLRINTSQGDAAYQIQEWIGDLKQQQLSDMDMYKSDLLMSEPPQPEIADRMPLDGHEQPISNEQNHWDQQFAEGFIAYLEEKNNPLLELWFGEKHSYPTYIGFDIRRSEDFNFWGSDTYWLAANLREKQVFAGIHFRNPLYFQELERQKSQIDLEFSQEFGRRFDWRPIPSAVGIFRISMLVGVDRNHSKDLLFEDLCKILEKLEEIFKDRLDTIFQSFLLPTRRSYNR